MHYFWIFQQENIPTCQRNLPSNFTPLDLLIIKCCLHELMQIVNGFHVILTPKQIFIGILIGAYFQNWIYKGVIP